MYSKHLISVTALLFSVACSSASSDDTGGTSGTGGTGASGKTGTGGSQPGSGGSGMGGTTGTTGGTGGSSATGGTSAAGGTGGSSPATGGSAGHATGGSGGSGAGTTGGTSGSGTGATGGTTPGAGGSAGTGNPGTGGAPNGGMHAGGAPGTGGSAMGGMTSSGGSGGSGGGTAVKCDNLTLAPSTTGVARPSGAAGGMKVLDWAGFKGAASFTFDDNRPSQMDDYSQLKATGGHFTWFVVGNWLNGNSSTIAKYKATMADGMEMANHTYSHQSGGSQSDLSQNETFIMTNFGVNANSMAAPNCDASWASVAPSVMFQNRGPCGNPVATVGAGSSDKTSPFALPAYLPATDEASDTMNKALTDGQWRIFVIHGFDLGDQPNTYQPVSIGHVTATISTAVSKGYWVEGISNVGAYWQAQKLIPAASTTSAMWTLPAKFPKNMCVRITTTGGTVTQKGQTIPWNDHGYYEIGLDAGEVTIQ